MFASYPYLHGDVRRGSKASVYATVGLLGSTVVQVLVTLSILVGFLVAVAV